MNVNDLPVWESMLKRIVWQQIGDLSGKTILDFGSGLGITASHFACDNAVTAVEPSDEALSNRWTEHQYVQLKGSLDVLNGFSDNVFDVIFCHNVLEYAVDRENIVRELCRVLKPDGFISLVKHNRRGRVMQTAVLLNDFSHANSLLDGQNGIGSRFGEIRYYEASDIITWCNDLIIDQEYGIRTFWDLQQNQEIQSDLKWQNEMIQLEMRVGTIPEFRSIAFFNHLMLHKKSND